VEETGVEVKQSAKKKIHASSFSFFFTGSNAQWAFFSYFQFGKVLFIFFFFWYGIYLPLIMLLLDCFEEISTKP
jgi:hypothetical protein